MPCTNCFDNCLGNITLDTCVRYTGSDNTYLGISSGDSLYYVLITLMGAIVSANSVANPTYTAACTFLSNIVGSTGLVSQQDMITGLMQAVCTLNTTVTSITPTPASFNTSCLTVASNPTRDQVLQATITKLCSLSTSLTTIITDYVKASQLCTLVNQCIANNVSSAQEYTKMNKYVALPYHGPTSVFDSNGAGLSAMGYDKVYMCLGQTINGFTLPDYRGRSPMGANSGVPTTGIDNAVNPALIANAGYGITNKQKIGAYTDTLTINQLAAHSHSPIDPGHSHFLGGHFAATGDDNNFTLLAQGGSDKTLTSTTGISIASTGAGQAHNTTHPSVGAIFIMYVP